ncbi:MAG: ATP phosphoribosyltransferase regulatory subunit [Lachnospiraceae bacterium]|nr:ATP phosphoribosyltransferase regulatory subunit [Lachnospiraceae bacterium]
MNLDESVLKKEEKTAFLLRSLYQQYGCLQYKMSKFEEYDLYAKNRDFLVSDNIITFTDTNGKLMALKPDVTLSIVRNTRDIPGYVNKVFYNENVYRVSRGSHAYKEIMQAGLECIGDIDDYNIFETVLLAVKSLDIISDENILSISHLGIIISLLQEIGLNDDEQKKAIKLIGSKNMHELESLCSNAAKKTAIVNMEALSDEDSINITADNTLVNSIERVMRILMLNGSPEDILPRLREEGCNEDAVAQLEALTSMLNAAGEGSRVIIDFSVVSDMSYYNGIVFKGYVKGVPESILSGGQYDQLLKKMGKRARAVGFAVYMDFLERYFENDNIYDVDAVIMYDDNTDRRALFNAVQVAMNKGMKVTAQKEVPEKLRCKIIYTIDKYGALKEKQPDNTQGKNKSFNNKEASNA